MARLLERADQLGLMRELLDDARDGHGHFVAVCAEAGGGKSALIQAFSDAVASQATVLTGWCDPFETPRPAGPLLDMGAGLGSSAVQILREEGRTGLYEAVHAELRLSQRPTVLVVEDAHWADGTTLDFLRFIGRRIVSLPALVLMTFRDDEIGPDHPLRVVLGDLATQRGVLRLELPPLSLAAVTELASDSDADARRILDVTGGNPFFVTEMVSNVPADAVPETVADSVVARLRRISEPARHAVTVAAMIGARAEPSLLYDVPGVGAAGLDEAVHAGLMRLTPPYFTFRHELVRQAVLSVTAAAQRQALAADVLSVRRQRGAAGDDLGRIAEIAEAAGDGAAVREFAPAAARRATELGAHREAAAQYDRALRHTDDEGERAELLEPMSLERYLLGQLPASIAARSAAVEIRRRVGPLARLGDDLRWLARLHWYSGDGTTAFSFATEAYQTLREVGTSPELAMSLSQVSQLHMLAGSYADSVSWGEQALEMSRELNLPDVAAHALNNLGTSFLATGDPAGEQMLRESLAISLEINNEDHAARAYVNLAGKLIDERRQADAIAFIEEGIEYFESRDLDLQLPYIRAMRAQSLVHTGRWDDAVAEAGSILKSTTGTRLHEYVALLPIAVVSVRRGEPADLDDLGVRAHEFDELQRLIPYACLRAESIWLRGGELGPDSDLLAIYHRGLAGEAHLELTELGVWLGRLGVPVADEADVAGPMRGAFHNPLEAAERLAQAGNVYDAALCLLSGGEGEVRSAGETFRTLGATPALARAQARLRELGATRIPRGPRRSTSANELGLTSRQAEVLTMVAEGLSNPEIAARLYLSERTVEHHVSAVLAKLGAETREEAARKYRYAQAGK